MTPNVSRTLNFQRIFGFENAHEEEGRNVCEGVHDKSSLCGRARFEHVCVDFKEQKAKEYFSDESILAHLEELDMYYTEGGRLIHEVDERNR